MKKKPEMTTEDWRADCEELLAGMKSGKIKIVDAVERNNLYGKVAKFFQLELLATIQHERGLNAARNLLGN